jgi:hypothetical protein
MKTTLEMPDAVFRRAKARAAQRGMSLRQFVTEAVREKLITESAATEKPWTRLAGKLQHLRKETARINRVLEREFERVEPEEWT